MDLNVFNKPSSKKNISYSMHPYTLLSVLPFTLEDAYDPIMEKALNLQIEIFNLEKLLN